VARAAKAKIEVVQALNPQIARDRTPPDRGAVMVRIPVGTTPAFAEAFERTRGAVDRLETVTLRFGEGLDDVARAHGTTARELRRLNGVKDSSELHAGIAIVVPHKKGDKGDKGEGTPHVAVATASGDGAATAADDDEILVAVPDRVFSYDGRERVFYQTREGDTLDGIADVLGVRTDDLVEWNNLDPDAKLHPKMVLQVYVRKDFDPTAVVLLDSARVKAVTLGSDEFLELEAARRGKRRLVVETKSGDTLAKLGRRYGLTVGDLARINRFSYNTELRDGQKVVVYAPLGEPPRDVAQGMAGAARRDRGVGVPARVGPGQAAAKTAPGKPAPAKTGKAVALRATTPPSFEGKQEAKSDGKSDGKGEGKSKDAQTRSSSPRATAPPPFEPRANREHDKGKEIGKPARPDGKPATAGKPGAKKK